jgi:hypothetical protein
MARLACILLLGAVSLCVAAPPAHAVPTKKLDDNLAAVWTVALETPSAQNPFGTGGPASGCFDLDHTLAPLAPGGVESCTVKPGTKIFVAASTFECSTFAGDTPGVAATEGELRACARQNDVQSAPPVTVDGGSVAIAEVETRLLQIALPAENIFGLSAGTEGQSVAHGWVALLHPLTPGTHTIAIGTGASTITTTITVSPGH